jgi:hypothetical protein
MNEARCAVHTSNAALGPCARCGKFVCELCVIRKAGLYCTDCGSMAVAARGPTPWERRDELGPVQGLWQTWKQSVFRPDTFFTSVRPDGNPRDAMFYGWSLLALCLVPNILFQALNFPQMAQSISIINGGHVPGWMASLTPLQWGAMLTVPAFVLYPLTFFVGAGMIHLGCVLFGANKNGFRATARVMGYAQGPIIGAAIPLVGSLFSLYLWVLLIFGVARTQEVSGGRAAAAVLTPSLLLGCCGGFAIGLAVAQQVLAHR